MAKITTLLLSLILVLNCSNNNKQNNVTFNISIGGNDKDDGNSVQQTSDGGFIVTGFFGSIDNSRFLLKTDSFGKEEWFKTFKKEEYDVGRSVQQTSDGGYVVIGGDWLIKTNSIGNEEWSKTIGEGFKGLESISETQDAGFILTGVGELKNNDERYKILLIKTDVLGNEEWEKAFSGSGGFSLPQGSSAQQTSDGGYIIFGFTDQTSVEGTKVWLIKTNREGIEEWNRTFKYGGSAYGRTGQQTSDGGFIVGGNIVGDGEQFDERSSYLLKTNSLGAEEWSREFKEPSISFVRQTLDGGYVFTGFSSSEDIWVAKTDSSGNILAK